VREGWVRVNDHVVRDAELLARQGLDRIEIDDQKRAPAERLVLILNKPRGVATTTKDEQGHDTVYTRIVGAALPWLAAVGQVGTAGEGLRLFSNDPVWSAWIIDPTRGPQKTYHVQVDRFPIASLLAAL
jgi:23S rRNA pseudouridine2605 synthase